MCDYKIKADDYIRGEVRKLLVSNPNGDEAYLWLVEQIKYYKRPGCIQTDYTKYILQKMESIVSSLLKYSDEESRIPMLALLI